MYVYIHRAMMGDIVVNELLCFLHNKFGTVPSDKLQTCMVGFYNEIEVTSAKQILFDIASKFVDDSKMPRLITRKGANKMKLECEDIISLYSLLDREKVVLPKLVSENLGRIPPLQPNEVNLVNVLRGMDELKACVKLLREELGDLKTRTGANGKTANAGPSSTWVQDYQPSSVKLPPFADSHNSSNSSEGASNRTKLTANSQKSASYAQAAQKGRGLDLGDQDGWEQPRHKQRPKPIYGERKTSAESTKLVAAVPDRRWRLYVGNIKANTSEREIEDYCADQNVRVMKVEVISQQDPDDPAKPVAMCVEFDYADKDKVMVPSFWPQGMRVRGWFLKKKKSWSTY